MPYLSRIELYIKLSISYIAYGSADGRFQDLTYPVALPGVDRRPESPKAINMSGNHRNGTPAYKRIQSEIRDRIASARLKPGDAVASERELAKTHKVSLMTARHALAGLEHEGIVERRLGAGTFVAVPKIHFNKLMSYTEQMSSRGLAPRSRVLVAKLIEGEPEVAARLGLPAASRPAGPSRPGAEIAASGSCGHSGAYR